jgi:D-alanyl-D-alanine carboxypeptidase
VNDLFNASLIASANNATNALARSTGISRGEFVKLMNEKALSLGATNTLFVEPTGISENNFTTATDFVKIAKVAFENKLISGVSQKKDYKFSAVNNKKYVHKIKSTNQLLGSEDLIIKGGKTGYIDESQYNFVTRMQDKSGKDVIVLVLGSKDKQSEFLEAKKLALWSWSKSLLPSVAGVSTVR